MLRLVPQAGRVPERRGGTDALWARPHLAAAVRVRLHAHATGRLPALLRALLERLRALRDGVVATVRVPGTCASASSICTAVHRAEQRQDSQACVACSRPRGTDPAGPRPDLTAEPRSAVLDARAAGGLHTIPNALVQRCRPGDELVVGVRVVRGICPAASAPLAAVCRCEHWLQLFVDGNVVGSVGSRGAAPLCEPAPVGPPEAVELAPRLARAHVPAMPGVVGERIVERVVCAEGLAVFLAQLIVGHVVTL
mmetsp:Transcript_131721/g.367199  ORF Transcript_131721/g.367199 Transcript_131721/m.367199 type:complete len:253 (-) Transcript_131721:1307-2065(-)